MSPVGFNQPFKTCQKSEEFDFCVEEGAPQTFSIWFLNIFILSTMIFNKEFSVFERFWKGSKMGRGKQIRSCLLYQVRFCLLELDVVLLRC